MEEDDYSGSEGPEEVEQVGPPVYPTLDTVSIPLENSGFTEEDVRNSIESWQWAAILVLFNDYIGTQTSQTFDKYYSSPRVLDHFNRGAPVPGEEPGNPDDKVYLVVAAVRRVLHKSTQRKTLHYLLALLPAKIKDGSLVFQDIVYYDRDARLDPKIINNGSDPFVPEVIFPFDPRKFTPAAIAQRVLNANFDEDLKKDIGFFFKLLTPFLDRWVKNRAMGGDWGHYVTSTTFSRPPTNDEDEHKKIKAYLVCFEHNAQSLDKTATYGLIDLRLKKYITDEEMVSFNNSSQELVQTFEGKFVRAETRTSKKRARGDMQIQEEVVYDAEEQDAGPAAGIMPEQEGEVVENPFSKLADGSLFFPDPMEIYTAYRDQLPEDSEIQKAIRNFKGRPDAWVKMTFPQDPMKWFLQNNPDLHDSVWSEAKKAINGLVMQWFSNNTGLNVLLKKSNAKVVWQPRAALDLDDDVKSALVTVLEKIKLFVQVYSDQAVGFTSWLMAADTKDFLFTVVEELSASEEITSKFFNLMQMYNPDTIKLFNDYGDLPSILFSLVHEFLKGLWWNANGHWINILSRNGYTFQQTSSFPLMKDLFVPLVNPTKMTDGCRERCNQVKMVLEHSTHRLSQQETLVCFGNSAFLVAVILVEEDYGEEYEVVVKPLHYPIPRRIYDHEEGFNPRNTLSWHISADGNGNRAKLVRVCSRFASTLTQLPGHLGGLATQFQLKLVDIVASIRNNFIVGAKIDELFDWGGDDAEELFDIIQADEKIVKTISFGRENTLGNHVGDLLMAIGQTQYLKGRFHWIDAPHLRAFALASIMPVFKIEGDQVVMLRIATFVLKDQKFEPNPRFFHETQGDYDLKQEEQPHSMSEHVKYDIFAGLA